MAWQVVAAMIGIIIIVPVSLVAVMALWDAFEDIWGE